MIAHGVAAITEISEEKLTFSLSLCPLSDNYKIFNQHPFSPKDVVNQMMYLFRTQIDHMCDVCDQQIDTIYFNFNFNFN